MDIGYINRLLWVSLLLMLWGFIGIIVDLVWKGTRLTPSGIPGETMFILGLLFGAVGQVLFRQALRIEVLESRISRLGEKVSKE